MRGKATTIGRTRPIYTVEERRRRDTTRWTLVQALLAPAQFAVFLLSLCLVIRYLVTGEGLWIATLWLVLGSGALPAPDPAEPEPSPSVTRETRESTSDQDPTTGFVSSTPGAV